MVNEYIPTTEEVRNAYGVQRYDEAFERGYKAEFDRWLAEVKAEAWEEGHQQPWELGEGGYALKAINPYRDTK